MKGTLLFLLLPLFFNAGVSAQSHRVNKIDWKKAGALPAAKGQAEALGVAGPVAGVHNNVLLVAGGANFPDAAPWLGGKKVYHNSVDVFKRDANDSLRLLMSVPLPFTIAYAATCTTSEGVFAAGGENEAGLRKTAFLLQWDDAANTIRLKNLPDLPFAVTAAAVVCLQNKLYLAGGERTGDVSAAFLVLDLANVSAGWRSMPPLPKAVSHAVMAVQSVGDQHFIYLIGGRKRNTGSTSDLYASLLCYNLNTAKWSEQKSLPYPLSAGTGMAVDERSILLFGGDAGETFHKAEALIAAIAKESDEAKKKVLNEEKIVVQSTHPGFCRQVWLYDTAKDKWNALDCMPFAAPVTTTAVRWNGDIIIPSGEIKAGVRSPTILMGKLSVHRK